MVLSIDLQGDDVVVIPAYQPSSSLVGLVQEIEAAGCEVVVVNDGSDLDAQPVFARLKEEPGVTVLRHTVNQGKGAALKTAFRYIREWKAPDTYIATMDADGQHLPADVMRVLMGARAHPGTLVLGTRDFDRDISLRSRLGNKITRTLFHAASGLTVSDTQTGLRAFGYPLLDLLLKAQGSGYEYETNVLLQCRRRGVPLEEVPIQTVYLDAENSTSHFRPVQDSLKVLGTMCKFVSASLASFALDYGLFMGLAALTQGRSHGLLFSNVAARLGSGTFNYLLNRNLVFRDGQDPRRTLTCYLLLAAGILLANNIVLSVYVLVLPVWLAKICTEVTLFLVSLTVQSRVIFRQDKPERKKVKLHDTGKPAKLA